MGDTGLAAAALVFGGLRTIFDWQENRLSFSNARAELNRVTHTYRLLPRSEVSERLADERGMNPIMTCAPEVLYQRDVAVKLVRLRDLLVDLGVPVELRDNDSALMVQSPARFAAVGDCGRPG